MVTDLVLVLLTWKYIKLISNFFMCCVLKYNAFIVCMFYPWTLDLDIINSLLLSAVHDKIIMENRWKDVKTTIKNRQTWWWTWTFITNSSDSFTNFEFRIFKFSWRIFIMISFSTGKLRKNLFWTNKQLLNGSNWDKFM